jgi:hypothetical protein
MLLVAPVAYIHVFHTKIIIQTKLLLCRDSYNWKDVLFEKELSISSNRKRKQVKITKKLHRHEVHFVWTLEYNASVVYDDKLDKSCSDISHHERGKPFNFA